MEGVQKEDQPRYPIAGKWTFVAAGPKDHHSVLTATDVGLVLTIIDRANGSKQDPVMVHLWRPGTSAFEKIVEVPVDLLAVAGVKDNLFLFVNDEPDTRTSHLVVQRYHIPTGTLTTDRTPAPLRDDRDRAWLRYGATTAVVGQRIYLFGGCCEQPAVWSYDTGTFLFKHVTDIPQATPDKVRFQHNMPVRWDGESFLVASGQVTGERDHQEGYALYRYHLEGEEWRVAAEFPAPYGVGTPVIHEGTLWWVGRSCVLKLNPSTGVFEGAEGTPNDVYFDSYNTVNMNFQTGLHWRGKHYLYTADRGYLFEWTPPKPAEWPSHPGSGYCMRKLPNDDD